MEALVVELRASVSDAAEARRRLAALGQLCSRDAALAAAAGDAGGLKVALDAIRIHPDDVAVCQLGWGLVALLCAASEDCCTQARRCGALRTLLTALRAHCDAPATAACCCAALAALTAENVADATAACAAGAADVLAATLAAHSGRAGVAAHACEALSAICSRSARNAVRVHAAGAAQEVLRALQAHGGEASVALPAMSALGSVVSAVGAGWSAEPLAAAATAALRAHVSRSVAVLRAACRLVAALAADAAGAQALLDAGAAHDVLSALQAWRDDDVVLTQGCVTLHALCVAAPSLAQQQPAFAAGAAEVASAALLAPGLAPLRLLLLLATQPDAARAAVAAGALDAAAPWLTEHHRATPEVKRLRRQLHKLLSDAAASVDGAAGTATTAL